MVSDLYADERRKPRIMVAGEFSAGKTRLINSLMGRDVLPSQVTSTSLPPIWLVHGTGDGVTVGVDGSITPLDFDSVDVESTAYCVLPLEAPLLEHVDIIDTPGNSDPNIPASCWERMLSFADGLIWCTSAMQAWRQSEKSACSDFPEALLNHASLLITQADRLPDDRQRGKVFKRVDRESAGLFADLHMASLINPDDVAVIETHIKARAEEMSLSGADAPEVDALRGATDAPAAAEPDMPDALEEDAPFIAAEAETDVAPTEDSEIVTPKFNAIWDAMPDDEDEDDDVQAPFANETGEVVQLSEHQKMLADSISNPDHDDAPADRGPAHRLWSKITEGADLDDNEQLKVCVQAMLEHLDALSKTRSTDVPLVDEKQSQTQGA